jgi:hypothetical protein
MRNQRTGLFTLLLIGGFVAWRNRFRIQQFLESSGIRVPMDTSSVTNTLRSGVARLSGRTQHAADSADRDLSAAV